MNPAGVDLWKHVDLVWIIDPDVGVNIFNVNLTFSGMKK